MEGLDDAVLPRAAGLDVDRLDLRCGQPVLEFFGDKLRAIVGADVLRGPMPGDRPLHELDHIAGLERPVGPQDVALPRVLIEDREHPQGPAPDRRVGDKVPRPHVVLVRRLGWQTGGAAPPHELPLGRRHPQPLQPAQATHLALAHAPAFLPQERGNPAVHVPRVRRGQGMDPLHQFLHPAGALARLVRVPGTGQLQDPAARPPGAHPGLHGRGHDLLLVRRAHNFFRGRTPGPFSPAAHRQHLLELRVLPLQFLQPLGFVQVAKLLPPTVERHVRDVLLPAHFHDALPSVHLPQEADFVFGIVAFSFHGLGPF